MADQKETKPTREELTPEEEEQLRLEQEFRDQQEEWQKEDEAALAEELHPWWENPEEVARIEQEYWDQLEQEKADLLREEGDVREESLSARTDLERDFGEKPSAAGPKHYASNFLAALSAYNIKHRQWDTNAIHALGLFLLSCIADRNVRVVTTGGTKYPSINVLLVGGTYSNKTSILNFGLELLQSVLPDGNLPGDTSAAALEQELAERAEQYGASKGYWVKDECSNVFDAKRKDWSAGLTQLFNTLFDCPANPPYTARVKVRGRKGEWLDNSRRMQDVYVPGFYATQPVELPRIYTYDRFGNGFARRLLPVYLPQGALRPLGVDPPPTDLSDLKRLVGTLDLLQQLFRKYPCRVTMAPDVLAEFNRYQAEFDRKLKYGIGIRAISWWEETMYTGLPEYALRIAVLLEMSNVDKMMREAPTGCITLTMESLKNAWDVQVPTFGNAMKRIIVESGSWQRFLDIVEKEPGVTRLDAYRHLDVSGEEFERILQHPKVKELVVSEVPKNARGRPAMHFYLKSDWEKVRDGEHVSVVRCPQCNAVVL